MSGLGVLALRDIRSKLEVGSAALTARADSDDDMSHDKSDKAANVRGAAKASAKVSVKASVKAGATGLLKSAFKDGQVLRLRV